MDFIHYLYLSKEGGGGGLGGGGGGRLGVEGYIPVFLRKPIYLEDQ